MDPQRITPMAPPVEVYRRLAGLFGEPTPPLHFSNPEQLAIAVILSAQCTDERVNQVTPALFAQFTSMQQLAKSTQEQVEMLIYSTGFYRNKARHIRRLAQILTADYQGKIPPDFGVLTSLPGIGRKSANVIMNQAFGIAPGIVVDTHVIRLSGRLGFSSGKNAVTIEKVLMKIFPKTTWKNFSLYLVFHGRQTCNARNPDCDNCILADICPSYPIFRPQQANFSPKQAKIT